MSDSLRAFIEKTEHVTSAEELFRLFDTFTGPYGIDVSSYHIMAKEMRAVPIETGLIRETFPGDWIETYLKKDYDDIDPVLSQARHEAEPFHWFEVEDKMKLSREQRFFLRELREAGLVDGLAIPIFGPKGTMAYFGLGSVDDKLVLPREQIMELQFACQRTHNKYLEINPELTSETPPAKLSGRETEVLTLVATGLSNNNIADRLGVTENTIDTILRRTFKKLDASNRITAVLKGIGAGLILP